MVVVVVGVLTVIVFDMTNVDMREVGTASVDTIVVGTSKVTVIVGYFHC